MKANNKEYFLVFDTNVLFQRYDKMADFTSFSFNATFENVAAMVNQLDIYDNIKLAIPEVVWNEMTKQIIDAHDKQITEYQTRIKNWKFPEYKTTQIKLDNYQKYIEERITEYKEAISSGINTIVELPNPKDKCFERIVKRAFDKAPPFGGKEKNSDKGFKDVLIWESILELSETHPTINIIFYTKDKGFKAVLIDEFRQLSPDAYISICSTEDEVKEQLEQWAQEIDIYSYQPIPEYTENKGLIEFLNSSDFQIQVIDRDFGIAEKNRLIENTTFHLLSYDNIEIIEEDENNTRYMVDAKLKVEYTFKGGASIDEEIDVRIEISCSVDEFYSVKDMYKLYDEEEGDECE